MAASLTDAHYIRCTNQWSDPATQVWLYGHDAEAEADRAVQEGQQSGIEEMVAAGLLEP
jgi:salicylate hydroxylase